MDSTTPNRARCFSAAFATIYVSSLFFQLVLAAAEPNVKDNPAGPLKPGTSNSSVDSDNTVTLSPFTVSSSDDKGYRATNTLAGTRLRTNLDDVGSAISVVTESFLQDTGARNSEDLLILTTGTETASTRGNYSAISVSDRDANGAGNLTRTNTNTRVRGLGSADNTRDFFLTDIPWDSYNTGRIDLQRGPNSILFGLGNPSGIINAGMNGASFKNSGNIQTREGSYGSYRVSLDANFVLSPNEIALRTSLLFDRTEYEQRPAFNKDRRFYAALRYDPKALNQGGSHFSIKGNFEAGHIDQSRARVTPPTDRITPWFNTMPVVVPANPILGYPARTFLPINKSVYDIYQAYRGYSPTIPQSGSVASNSTYTANVNGVVVPNLNFQPGISEMYTDGVDVFFPNSSVANVGSPIGAIIFESNRTQKFGLGPNGNIDQTVGGIPYARFIGLTEPWKLAQFYGKPFYGGYVANSLTDPSIFNFYTQLLDGPNKPSFRGFEAMNVDLNETLFNNRIGFDFAYDRQRYRDGQNILYTDRYYAIGIDINATLQDGSANPNVGRPYISARSTGGGSALTTLRESTRSTLFAELRATDFLRKSLLTSIFGRHVFTGVYSTDKNGRDSRSFASFLLDQGFPLYSQNTNSTGSRSLQTYQYIGPSLLGSQYTGAAGLNLQAPTSVINPTSLGVRYFDSHWVPPVNSATSGYVDPSAPWFDSFSQVTRTQSENPANYKGWTTYNAQVLNAAVDGPGALTTDAALSRNRLSTKAFNWQGFMFDDTVVPLFGYRKDTNKVYNTTAVKTADGIAQIAAPSYVIADNPRAIITTEIRSWGGVLHMPKFVTGRLPWGTNFSLTYNRSSNFNPSDVGRVDVLNKPLAPSQGKTEDYGFIVSTLNDKINLRVNWYRASVANASFSWGAPFGWVYDDESRAWQSAKRLQAGLSGDPTYAGPLYNYYETINGVQTFTDAAHAKQVADVNAYLANVPYQLFAAGGVPNPPDSTWIATAPSAQSLFAGINGARPTGYTATRDTFSKGVELELTINPTKNWTIFANATKTKASTTNNLGDIIDWVIARNVFWNGPAGNVQLFNNDISTTSTVKADWNNNVGFPLALQQYSNGANVQELAKWRFNVVSNYGFSKGFLKGVKVGGSYTWVGKTAVGYPWTYLTINGALVESPNIKTPIYGPSDSTIGLWIGYSHKLTAKINWEIQLNANNAFGKNKLIPISVEPDGSIANYRIKEKGIWTLTNTLKL